MRTHCITIFLLAMLLPPWAADGIAENVTSGEIGKKYDLVLVHGLANRHEWSDDFLETCLEIWGSGRVFVVYTNQNRSVVSKNFSSGTIFYSGGDGHDAGIYSIDEQTKYLADGINVLLNSHGLKTPFSIIAHSMGGLVARQYIYENPDTVAGLVTLGTPHHGSPLADSFQWASFFINATDAVVDITTDYVSQFNRQYPVNKMVLSVNKKMFTIRGDADRLVPSESAVIDGADNIADFPDYNHNDLVRRPEVAKAAAAYLP